MDVRSEVIHNNLIYITEEMGIILRNSAYSSNIKERMDHSCAIFDPSGRMLAQAEHIPVHLGSMPLTVKRTLKIFTERKIDEGDVIIVNHPFMGGTHLPDITMITPVFYKNELVGYTVNRAHHSDVGGKTPGSMPPNSITVHEEGIIIPPVKLFEAGRLNDDILEIILSNTRTPKIRKGDIYAQLAANNVGTKRLLELIDKYGYAAFMESINNILDYTERLIRNEIRKLPEGVYQAEDYMELPDKEKLVKIMVNVVIKEEDLIFDFTGSSPQVDGAINAPLAVTMSSSYYVLRCITNPDIPSNDGSYKPLEIIAPIGTIVNATYPSAVVGGNVETSQRIVDVLLKALSEAIPKKVTAASQGTMNNVSIGGIIKETGEMFTFYETIGGGAGAGFNHHGESGVHTHMTNTMNTPIEEIERRFPIMILEYSIRENSGGIGKWKGGDGIRRVYKFLTKATVSLLGERHRTAPWGLFGGENGKPGVYYLLKENGDKIILNSKQTVDVREGDVLVIETPGGGGYKKPEYS